MRRSDEVHVVRHQAVAEQRQTIKLRILPQQRQVGQTIGIAGENHLSRVAALRNMMRYAYYDDARESSHPQKNSRDVSRSGGGDADLVIRHSQIGRKELGSVPSVPVIP